MSRQLDQEFGWSSLSLLSASVKETRKILGCRVASEHVATLFGHLVETSQIVSTEFQLRVKLEVAWPSVRTVLLGHPDSCNAKAYRHWGASGRLQRPFRTVAQELAVLIGNCMESSWTSSRTLWPTDGMKWDIAYITWRIWIEPIILLKSNRYIKCFCQLECCQYKILTHPHLTILGQKTLDRFGNTLPV